MTASRIRLGAAGLAAAAALLVTGCGILPSPAPVPTTPATVEPAPGDQAQQCAQVLAEVSAIATDVGRVGEMLATDPFGALALVGSISTRVGDLETRVTDPALLERIGEIQAGWDALVADAQESLASGDAAGIERARTALVELGDRVVALQEFCAGTP
ncbi:hypothetical protein L332_01155 [Agrococcus pavilionensis RW1]|uniref:Uncharacterized protein n=1 Tax=Agrococcus pavilionensis RW1 TaxID=1330458 RepID=U1MMF6_9MICO|nr:hypothetical protein [Agrococcus pavilionensis]ERG63066.1 hypothetical protein L332_01155 [Agrococcus pavilionensis RW1]